MKLLVLTVLVMLVTSCGVRPTGAIMGGPAPTEELDGAVLYLVNDNVLTRVVRPKSDQMQNNLQLLAEGPTPEESATGLTTDLPPNMAPIETSGTPDSLTVKISAPVATLTEMAMNQLTCTAQQPWQNLNAKITLSGPDQTLSPRTCPFTA